MNVKKSICALQHLAYCAPTSCDRHLSTPTCPHPGTWRRGRPRAIIVLSPSTRAKWRKSSAKCSKLCSTPPVIRLVAMEPNNRYIFFQAFPFFQYLKTAFPPSTFTTTASLNDSRATETVYGCGVNTCSCDSNYPLWFLVRHVVRDPSSFTRIVNIFSFLSTLSHSVFFQKLNLNFNPPSWGPLEALPENLPSGKVPTGAFPTIFQGQIMMWSCIQSMAGRQFREGCPIKNDRKSCVNSLREGRFSVRASRMIVFNFYLPCQLHCTVDHAHQSCFRHLLAVMLGQH